MYVNGWGCSIWKTFLFHPFTTFSSSFFLNSAENKYVWWEAEDEHEVNILDNNFRWSKKIGRTSCYCSKDSFSIFMQEKKNIWKMLISWRTHQCLQCLNFSWIMREMIRPTTFWAISWKHMKEINPCARCFCAHILLEDV